jgi:hypothetical protein
MQPETLDFIGIDHRMHNREVTILPLARAQGRSARLPAIRTVAAIQAVVDRPLPDWAK